MILIWNILLTLAAVVTWPALFVWAWVGKHRLADRLGFLPECPDGAIWIHAASVGETGVAAIIRNMTGNIEPERSVILTATTKTGIERLEKSVGSDSEVAAIPADHPLFMSIAFKRVKPTAIIIVETELWPNLLLGAKRRNIPVILANGRISGATMSWAKRFPRTFKKITDCVDIFLMKSDYDAENLKATGVADDRIKVFGNIKFAGIPEKVFPEKLPRAPVIVAGSVRPREFARVAEAFVGVRENYPDALAVLAPRHINTVPQLVQELHVAGLKYVLRTERESPGDAAVYIIDTMGELLKFYAGCDIAFVGGTLSDYGGHNPLEPACFGKPVLFGPYFGANREAYEMLLRTGGGRIVRDSQELAGAVIELLLNGESRNSMGSAAREAVEKTRQIPEKYKNALREFFERL